MVKLEYLANEILLDLFTHLPSVVLLRSFYNLNHRFNNLLHHHFQFYPLDFRSISQTDFNQLCSQSLPALTEHITSLALSNDDNDTPKEIDLFYQHNLTIQQFTSLKSLSIYDLCSNELLDRIASELKFLPDLTHLKFAGCYVKFSDNNTQQFIDSIWSLSTLISCYLNIYFDDYNEYMPNRKSFSLKSLSIWGVEHDQTEINRIIQQTPNLEYFSILLRNNDAVLQTNSSIKTLQILSTGLEEHICFNMFYLNSLVIDLNTTWDNVLDGYQWERIIRKNFSDLKIFRLRMEFGLYEDQQVHELINSFNNSFWIEEHHWFIRCHWFPFKPSTSVFFYTLPYIFKDFFLDCAIEYQSTCSNYLDYNYVKDLKLTRSSKENLLVSKLRFLNLNQLSINFPISENLYSIIPKFDQITSLDVSIDNNCTEDNQLQLKSFISKIPYLYSLTINSLLIFDLMNPAIRRLYLYDCDEYLNDEQCYNLIHSSLGIQCEILIIKIKRRSSILDLINNMNNLRTLDFTCEDDQFKRTEANNDELLLWLNEHLPSTCSIQRDSILYKAIGIWIR